MEMVKFPVNLLTVIAVNFVCAEGITSRLPEYTHGYVPEEDPNFFEWVVLARKVLSILLVLIGALLYIVPESRYHARKGCHKIIDFIANGLKSIIGEVDNNVFRRPPLVTTDSFTSPDPKYSILENYSYALAREHAKNLKKIWRNRRRRSDSSEISERGSSRHIRRKYSKHGEHSHSGRRHSSRERHRKRNEKSASKYPSSRESVQKVAVLPVLYPGSENCDICHRADGNLYELSKPVRDVLLVEKDSRNSSTQLINFDPHLLRLATPRPRDDDFGRLVIMTDQQISKKNDLRNQDNGRKTNRGYIEHAFNGYNNTNQIVEPDSHLPSTSKANNTVMRSGQTVPMTSNSYQNVVDPVTVKNKEEVALDDIETDIGELKRVVKEIKREREKTILTKKNVPIQNVIMDREENEEKHHRTQNLENWPAIAASHCVHDESSQKRLILRTTNDIPNVDTGTIMDNGPTCCSGYNEASTIKRTWNWLLNGCPTKTANDTYPSELGEN